MLDKIDICTFRFVSQYVDKRIDGGVRSNIQDNFGSDYAVTSGGFSGSAKSPK